MYLNIYFYIFFSFLIFFIGLFGLILSKRNSFLILISLEIMFMSIHLNFSYAAFFLDDIFGIVAILFILSMLGYSTIIFSISSFNLVLFVAILLLSIFYILY